MFHRQLPIAFLIMAVLSSAIAEDYYPLQQGMSWEYVLNTTYNDLRESATIIRKVLPPTTINGQAAMPIQHSTEGKVYAVVFYAKKENGVVIVATQRIGDPEPLVSDRPELVVPKRTQLGTSWKYWQKTQIIGDYEISTTSVIDKTDESVTVSAGEFKHCLRISISGSARTNDNSVISIQQYEWYAPNVGRVKTVYEETLISSASSSKRTCQIEHFLVRFSK